jgi:hypothetical protein
MIQAIQHKEPLTNEYLMTKFSSQFKLALVGIDKAVSLIKSGAVENEGIINVAAQVLEEMGEETESVNKE